MELPLMEHIRHTLTLDKNKDVIIEKLLSLTLEIIHLLTKEDFVVVRKPHEHRKDGDVPCVLDHGSRAASPADEESNYSGTEENGYDRMDLRPMTSSLEETKKVAVKCEEVSGLSLTDWDCSAIHKDGDMDKHHPHPPGSVGGSREKRTAESRRGAPYSQDRTAGDKRTITQDYQSYVYTEGYGLQISSQKRRDGAWMYAQQCTQEEAGHVTPGGRRKRNLADGCGSAPYPEACIERGNRTVTQDYQVEDGDVMIRCKEEEEEAPDDIGADHSEVEVKLYHCTECDECFTDPSDFSFHQKAHNASHLFSCAICRVSFKSESTFVKHQRCHAEGPPSPCQAGEQSFMVRSTIVRYSGEKPFQCTECGRCFALKSTLVKHQRVHTGERPFVCRQCGRSFSQSCNLLRHLRRCQK